MSCHKSLKQAPVVEIFPVRLDDSLHTVFSYALPLLIIKVGVLLIQNSDFVYKKKSNSLASREKEGRAGGSLGVPPACILYHLSM